MDTRAESSFHTDVSFPENGPTTPPIKALEAIEHETGDVDQVRNTAEYKLKLEVIANTFRTWWIQVLGRRCLPITAMRESCRPSTTIRYNTPPHIGRRRC